MASPRRPNFLDLHAQSQTSVTRPLRSPRLPAAGDVPPELSPLDAIALQSRLLARQLEESAKADHRVSRLPPLTTSSPLVVQGRSEYFRSLSYDTVSDGERGDHSTDRPDQQSPATTSQPTTPSGFGIRTPDVEEPCVRPQSMHPRMSRVPPTPDFGTPPPVPEYSRGRQNFLQQRNQAKRDTLLEDSQTSFFGARRERSPSPLAEGDRIKTQEILSAPKEASQPAVTTPQFSTNSRFSFAQSPERNLVNKNSFDSSNGGLVPPRPIFPKRSSSIMSSPLENTDDESHNTMGSSFHSLSASRKLSVSSMGLTSPGFGSFNRSPSIGSDISAPLPRPSFNFSRPLSRVGTPGLESPARQASSDSQTSYSQSSLAYADDSANTPVSVHSEGFPDSTAPPADGTIAPPYIYSKYALPRGKMLERPAGRDDNQGQSSQQWDQSMVPPSNIQTLPHGGQAPPSPPNRPSSSGNLIPRPSLERSKLSMEVLVPTSEPSPNPSRPSTDGDRSSEDTPRGRNLERDAPARGRTPASMATSGTSDSASTIKARSARSLATAAEIPAEEHVEKAIALHENGQLNESTYHLRLAARQGNPTGMLLYALACRHGWGMRANPREGAEWLRKAADCASLEIADDEAMIKEGKTVNIVDRKTRKAQFALSIYELGVSYLNGWGIDQDKPLALRCFEIAGSWGDVDALAEAGFCYAQAIGCKKNMKKSAQFYRQAEAKGMSMVGNSWIHKPKYDEGPTPTKEKKARSKSRGRHMFGMKHS